MLYQQGDVLIQKIENNKIEGKKLPHLILAEGEATGHCHKIAEGEAELIDDGQHWYLKVLSEEAILTHQEHDAIRIPRGNYQIRIVQEYDHFLEESRNVLD